MYNMKRFSFSSIAFAHSQRGAMFGLDARIALAIFGILSVVAGVAAYNVMGQASSTALVTELSNLKKAYTEFHLATGEHTNRFLDLLDNDSGYIGWSGPYIDGMSNDKSRTYGTYSIVEGRQDVAGVPPVECTGGLCGVWLKLTRVKDTVGKDVDKALDAEESPNNGTFRIEYLAGPTDDVYYLIATKPAGSSSSNANTGGDL
jgi:hypothetical protein